VELQRRPPLRRNDGQDQTDTTRRQGLRLQPAPRRHVRPKGDGSWTVNAGIARYVAAIASGIGTRDRRAGARQPSPTSTAGRRSNTDLNTPNPVPVDQALTTVFDWFFANGGTRPAAARNPTYPGSTRSWDGLVSPSVWEYSLGLTKRLGSKASPASTACTASADFYTSA